MKSKTILPESERQDAEAEIMVRMPDFGPDIWGALLAAENEIEENLNQFTETFKKKDDELREKVIQIQALKKEIKEYKKLAKDNLPELAKKLKERPPFISER